MSLENPTSKIEHPPAPSALYRAVWRWHFYAGLLVAPFAMFLAVTGAIYLWKPQYEDCRYHRLLHVPARPDLRSSNSDLRGAAPPSADALLTAALANHPRAAAVTFTPAFAPDRSSEIVLRLPGGERTTVYVDPHTGAVLGEVRDSERFMRLIHDLHGTLLAGRTGEYVVELAASWALVLFLTGLYLHWPRPRFHLAGFLVPLLRADRRTFWRDLHAVPAVWLSLATIFLLSTGLLWTQAAGGWYRKISAAAGQATPRESTAGAHRSELVGWSPPLRAGLAEKIDTLASADPHAEHRVAATSSRSQLSILNPQLPPRLSLDRVLTLAEEHRVPRPYAVAFPVGPTGVFSVLTDRDRAFDRGYLHLDQYSGRVLADVRSRDFGFLARFSLWAIIAHEGRLFGLANQLLGTVAAVGVCLLAVSGLVLWWARRPAGRLAAPPAVSPLPPFVGFGLLVLALLLPLLAASLVILVVLDFVAGRRLAVRNPT